MVDRWTREQTIVAFNLYCKIPFKDCRKTHPLIVKYAEIIGRSPSALNMKIGNIGRLDPKLREKNIVGLSHGAKIEEEIWEEFYNNPDELSFEIECIIAKYKHQEIEDYANLDVGSLPNGKERMALVKQRIGQSFFRSVVMCSYDFRCCISGIGNTELLDACHIVGWSEDCYSRSNPENGLCLNPFFHKAYDRFLIAITPDYNIVVSDEMIDKTKEESFRSYLEGLQNKKISMPNRFFPKREFLDIHYRKYLNNT